MSACGPADSTLSAPGRKPVWAWACSIQWLACVAIVMCAAALAGCKTLVPPPYPRGNAPATEVLMQAARPSLAAIQVPEAKIRANWGIKGSLAFLAQSPQRFRGSVTVKGNEVASLATHERGYDLVYKLDDIPSGYYTGADPTCAIAVVVGIGFHAKWLVDLVLGGAPILADGRVVRRGWDGKRGHEVIELVGSRFIEELRFAPVANQAWRFSGATLWKRAAKGKGDRVWSVDHEAFRTTKGTLLPSRTRIDRPGGVRDQFVEITYGPQETEPAFARADPRRPQGDNRRSSSLDGQAPQDDDPWQEEGGGWQGQAGEVLPQSPAANTVDNEPAAADLPEAAQTDSVPPLFRLSAGGLPARGDVCRYVR